MWGERTGEGFWIIEGGTGAGQAQEGRGLMEHASTASLPHLKLATTLHRRSLLINSSNAQTTQPGCASTM